MEARPDAMDDHVMGTIYVFRFSEPLGDPERPRCSARYYVGWTEKEVEERLQDHLAGRGAKITAAAVAQGIELEVIWTQPGTRLLERRIKLTGHFERFENRTQPYTPKKEVPPDWWA